MLIKSKVNNVLAWPLTFKFWGGGGGGGGAK